MTPTPGAIAQPAAAKDEEPALTLMIPTPRRGNVAATAAIGILLLAGVPTAIVLWRGRATPASPNSAAAAQMGTVLGPGNGPSTAGPAADLETPKPATPAPTIDAPLAKVAPPDTASLSRAALPIVTFGKMKLLEIDGGKSRDRDTSLRLGADGFDILENGNVIQNTLYQDVIGLFHSRSRDPRWTMSDGAVVPVAKAGGKFSFLRGVPDWITIRTRRAFIPMQVPAGDLKRVIAELESRTGATIVRTP
jgi:hypothetical protein